MATIDSAPDNFDSAFERIETPTGHGTVHIRYQLTDVEIARLCGREPPRLYLPDVSAMALAALIANPPYGGEDPVALDLPVLLVDVLGYSDGEFVSIGHDGNGSFVTAVMAITDVGDYVAYVAGLPDTANVYFGVNPIAGYVRGRGGRGKAADVTRLAALWCDLDVKPGAFKDIDVAQQIISELSGILGTRPAAVTYSGSRLHAYWRIDDDEDEIELGQARALLARWGRLVKAVAQSHGAAADSVFDLPRMLRAPGIHNNKAQTNGQPGPLVRTLADCGGPLTVAEINERLNEFGIYENVNDRGVPGDSGCDPEHLDLRGWVVRLREDHDRRRSRPGGRYG